MMNIHCIEVAVDHIQSLEPDMFDIQLAIGTSACDIFLYIVYISQNCPKLQYTNKSDTDRMDTNVDLYKCNINY